VAAVLADPNCPAWRDVLSRRLYDYAHGPLYRWACAGSLRQQAHDVRGIGRVPQGLRVNAHEADWLVAEILAVALRTFVRTSLPKWDPALGRSLDAYFMTWCLMKLPDAYEAWHRREVGQSVVQVSVDESIDPPDRRPRPDDIVAMRDALRELGLEDHLAYRVLLLKIEGYKLLEIEEFLTGEGFLRKDVKAARKKLADFIERHEQGDGGSEH
jgi:hypothetical protein